MDVDSVEVDVVTWYQIIWSLTDMEIRWCGWDRDGDWDENGVGVEWRWGLG